jgi:hypothetical protein
MEGGFDEDKVQVKNNLIDASTLEPAFEPGDYALFFGRLSGERA